MGKRGRLLPAVAFLLLFALAATPAAADYVAEVQLAVEKSLYGPGEEVHLSGSILLSNLSANDTGFLAVSGASVNFSISNSSGLQSQYLLNTSSDGSYKSRSDLFPAGIKVNLPSGDGYYNTSSIYRDPNSAEWKSTGVVRVFANEIDQISISPAEAKYYSGESVVITLKAIREIGDKKVTLANFTINGSMRYTNRTVISKFSCVTADNGVCTASVAAPSAVATYLLEANNFLSTSSFVVVPFEAFVYVKDSTGESFKELFKANEVATIEINVKSNGSLPTGDFVFNGTITDKNSVVIANITSTALESNNSYSNRFSFTISNAFPNGVYYVSVTVFKTGTTNRVSSTASFQVRSWSLTVIKAAENSGFDYEYTAFPDRNVSFEIYPKEHDNGTVITDLNSTQFNITLGSKTGSVLSIGNASWNSSCSSTGCYQFVLKMPSAAGRYLLTVSLNYSNNEVQSVHRLVSVTDTSLSATPSNEEGQLKELFGTSESVYISLTGKSHNSTVNITDILVESILYENGTKFNFTEVSSWSSVNSSNSALEFAWNGSAQRLKLDAPKTGGNYLINIFASNRSAAASTKFSVNPYTVCGVAKSTAGSVDSSSSFYVWQYKTTDTIYLELKVSQAQNSIGRAAAENNTFNSANQGMGRACQLDTSKVQAITNATLVIEGVFNLQSGAKAALNTSASTCSADDNSGAYTCTIKPDTKWDGGRYSVKLKVTGSDGETVDKADSIFEARAFYIWSYSDSWTNKPTSNITFNVQMYEAGTNWWSNLGSTGGLNGEVAIQKVEYNGKDGEWLWPPVDIAYNTTGLNASNISNGRGSFTLLTNRLPKGRWEPGYYVVTIKGTNTATGESDYGQAWLGIKQWDSFSTPVEVSGSSIRYKDSFGVRENLSLFVRITNAGDYNDNGGTNLAGGSNVSVGIKKLQYYTTWPPTELNKSAYTATVVNVTTSSPWYWNANAGHIKYIINLSPASGRWDSGYYNAVLDVNGSETGYGWFNVIAFGVDTQPTNANGGYTYAAKGTGPRYFNVTATKSKKSFYSYYAANDYINTTVKDMVLRVWREDTWQTEELNYPENLNISPGHVNGTALVTVNRTGSWPAGYYWGEITLQDAENSTGTGYIWFSVRAFRVDASVLNYTVDSDSNVSVSLNIRDPDWATSTLAAGNYTITQIYEDIWSGSGRSRTAYANYKPSNSSTFNATAILNITPNSGSWSTGNSGYHYLTVVVQDNSDNTTQTGWVSFRAVPYTITVSNIPNQYSFSQTSNVTVNVSVKKSSNGEATAANLSRVFEYTYPTQTEYAFAVGECKSATSGNGCQVNGTQNITLVMPSGGWPSGWHYIYLEFLSPNGASRIQADNSVWFNAVQAYDGLFTNADEGGMYKYDFSVDQNFTIKITVRDSNYVPQVVNVTKVEMSEDGSNCWSESCKNYATYSYSVLNGSGGNEIKGNGTIRILHNGSSWKRGQHSIKATVTGSAGTAVIKTGYVNVKDTSAPNITIVSPTNGQIVTTATFLFNATTNENTVCYISVVSHDQFFSWYCSGSSEAACDNVRFNGSTAYFTYYHYPPYGPMNTGGLIHHYTVNTEGWTNQDYGIYASCADSDWNYATAKVAFTLNTSLPVRPVTVNLTSPANASAQNSSNLTFLYNVSGPVSGTANCSIYVNVSNTWRVNMSLNTSLGNNTGSPLNVSAFNNGTYVWNAYCFHTANSTNNAWAASNFTFTVANNATSPAINLTAINITLLDPLNASAVNYSTFNLTYNFTAGASFANCDVYSNISGSWGIVNSSRSVNFVRASIKRTEIPSGSYLWNVYCVNTSDGYKAGWGNSGNFTFNVANNETSSPFLVNISGPANNSVINTSNVTFVFNVTGTMPSVANCTIFVNVSNIWRANMSNSSIPINATVNHNFTVMGFNNGAYVWNSYCYQTSNATNSAWAVSNFTFNTVNSS